MVFDFGENRISCQIKNKGVLIMLKLKRNIVSFLLVCLCVVSFGMMTFGAEDTENLFPMHTEKVESITIPVSPTNLKAKVKKKTDWIASQFLYRGKI